MCGGVLSWIESLSEYENDHQGLCTIRKTDRILVMHHGRIREQGTHKELMDLRGIYFRLNRVKSPGFGDLLIHDRSI